LNRTPGGLIKDEAKPFICPKSPISPNDQLTSNTYSLGEGYDTYRSTANMVDDL